MPWWIYVIAGLVGAIIGLEFYHWVDKHDGFTFKIKGKKK